MWRWDQQEPFGANPAIEDPDANSIVFDLPLRLPGQRYDAETAVHYNLKRDGYDATIGRYTQPDPIGGAFAAVAPMSGLNHLYVYARSNPLTFIDPDGLCPCAGGIWDEEMGDVGFQAAFIAYVSGSNINLICRSNKNLKCSGKQFCIGGGPIFGGGIGWSLGGRVSGANDSTNLSGWGSFGGVVSGGAVSVQANSSSVQSSAGVSWKGGGALVRCVTYQMKCNCPCAQ
ncbi:MAG: RHS repeat-associated core domain-containing protein [Gemmatimonadaceae bacterium]